MLSDPYAEPTAIIIVVVVVVFAQGKKQPAIRRRSKCQNKNKGHPATANAKRASRKKMSSPDLDSVVQQQVHYIAGYNHSDWQPITLTLVEYPKGKRKSFPFLFHTLTIRRVEKGSVFVLVLGKKVAH